MKFKVEKRAALYGWVVVNMDGLIVDVNGKPICPAFTKTEFWLWKLRRIASEVARVLNFKEQSNEV